MLTETYEKIHTFSYSILLKSALPAGLAGKRTNLPLETSHYTKSRKFVDFIENKREYRKHRETSRHYFFCRHRNKLPLAKSCQRLLYPSSRFFPSIQARVSKRQFRTECALSLGLLGVYFTDLVFI